MEAGESIVAAVVREFFEETGLEAVCGPLRGWVERLGVDHHFVILDFEVTLLSDGEPTAGSDAAAAEWVGLDDFAGRELADGLLEFLVEHGIVDDVEVVLEN